MLSDDVYIARRRAIAAELQPDLDRLGKAVSARIDEEAGSWHLALRPTLPEACPLELVLRPDQCLDIAVGGESHENLPIDTLDLIPALVRAVVAGDVIIRTLATAATAIPVTWLTIVGRDAAPPLPWQASRHAPLAKRLHDPQLIASDRRFAPYAGGTSSGAPKVRSDQTTLPWDN